jgi:hypothetical protein
MALRLARGATRTANVTLPSRSCISIFFAVNPDVIISAASARAFYWPSDGENKSSGNSRIPLQFLACQSHLSTRN